MATARSHRSVPRLIDGLLGPIVARAGLRFLKIPLERIGEIAFGLDLFVKMSRLGWLPRRRAIVVAPPERVCNPAYLSYWREHVRVVSKQPWVSLLRGAAWSPHVGYDLQRPFRPDGSPWDSEEAGVAAQVEWERQGRLPLLRLRPEDEERGRTRLRNLGVPDDAWFACLHVREPGYLRETRDSHRWYRSADPMTHLPAVREIVRRGGWVVRLGDPSMTPLPPEEGLVDYALHELRSDWMDVFLVAACRFVLGSPSGMVSVATTFGVPVAAVNWVPLYALPKQSTDIALPKLYRRDGRVLTLAEVTSPPFLREHDGRVLDRLGVDMIDNTAEEIVEVTVEMLERTEGAWPYTEEDERLQERFRALLTFHDHGVAARVARDFLRRHADLLP